MRYFAGRDGLLAGLRVRLQCQKGFTMLETLTASAVLGIVAASFMVALASVSLTAGIAGERAVSARIAERQLEYAKGQPYVPAPSVYAAIPVDDGYAVQCESVAMADPDRQKVVVTITRNGETLLVAEDYKVNR